MVEHISRINIPIHEHIPISLYLSNSIQILFSHLLPMVTLELSMEILDFLPDVNMIEKPDSTTSEPDTTILSCDDSSKKTQ